MQVLAPACPDCGAICLHPLTIVVNCEKCGGTGGNTLVPADTVRAGVPGWCPDCNGTGKLIPPPPTDEQIFGRECSRCRGLGKLRDYDEMIECPNCNGTGRVGACENRWTCLGATHQHHAHWRSFGEGDPRNGWACELCKQTWTAYQPKCLVKCPGRTDVRADPTLWEEVRRAWRIRTKTTVIEHAFPTPHPMGKSAVLFFAGGPVEFGKWTLRGLLPGEPENWKRTGKWTIAVTFEPEELEL